MAKRDRGPGFRVAASREPDARWSEVIGRNIEAARVARGWTQEELAARLRLDGLSWRRSSIALLEDGGQDVSVNELLLFADVLGVPMARLIHVPGTRRVAVTDVVSVNNDAIIARLTATPEQTPWYALWADEEVQRRQLQAVIDDLPPNALGKSWGATAEQALQAAADVANEAVVKAAKVIERSPFELALASQITWGRGFVAERDHRLEMRGEGLSPRSRQAVRGRITRELLAELSELLPKMDEGADQ